MPGKALFQHNETARLAWRTRGSKLAAINESIFARSVTA